MYRIAVTNRHLCEGGFLNRIEMLAQGDYYDAILLREKDLSEEEYRTLSENVLSICRNYGKECILHTFWQTALKLSHPFVHLPLPVLAEMPSGQRGRFRKLGVSVHSLEQLRWAEQYGASYVTAGHIFPTDCKRGEPPRGIGFLREICDCAHVPVYGIGGISPQNEEQVTAQGAAGVCVMSGCMTGKCGNHDCPI